MSWNRKKGGSTAIYSCGGLQPRASETMSMTLALVTERRRRPAGIEGAVMSGPHPGPVQSLNLPVFSPCEDLGGGRSSMNQERAKEIRRERERGLGGNWRNRGRVPWVKEDKKGFKNGRMRQNYSCYYGYGYYCDCLRRSDHPSLVALIVIALYGDT